MVTLVVYYGDTHSKSQYFLGTEDDAIKMGEAALRVCPEGFYLVKR